MSHIKSNITPNTVIMNLRLIPDNMSIEEALQIADEYKIIFYDSKLTDEKPRIINENEDMDKILLDISSLEGKAKYDEIVGRKEDISKLEGMCQRCKEVFNQTFMDTFIFGESLLVIDDEYNIRRVAPMSDEFMKLKQQEDV